MEIQPTWSRVIVIWWSFAWRNLIGLIISMVVSVVAGAIAGFILGAIGIPVPIIQGVGASIGLCLGLVVAVVPLKMILGKNYGEFCLVHITTNVDAGPIQEGSKLV